MQKEMGGQTWEISEGRMNRDHWWLEYGGKGGLKYVT